MGSCGKIHIQMENMQLPCQNIVVSSHLFNRKRSNRSLQLLIFVSAQVGKSLQMIKHACRPYSFWGISLTDKLFFFIFPGLSSRLLSWPQLNLNVIKRFNDWMTAIQKVFLNTESLCNWNHFSWFPGCWIYTMSHRVTRNSLRVLLQQVLSHTKYFLNKTCHLCPFFFVVRGGEKTDFNQAPFSFLWESEAYQLYRYC